MVNEENKEIESDSYVFSLKNWVDGGTIYRDWKDKDESGFQDGDGENTNPLRLCMYVTSLRYPSGRSTGYISLKIVNL